MSKREDPVIPTPMTNEALHPSSSNERRLSSPPKKKERSRGGTPESENDILG